MRYRLALLAGVFLTAAGCTPSQYARSADKTAYQTIDQAYATSLATRPAFDVAYKPLETTKIPLAAATAPAPGASPATAPAASSQPAGRYIQIGEKSIAVGGDSEPTILTLDEAMEAASRNARELQNKKEDLYVKALLVANTRREWTWSKYNGNIAAAAHSTVTNGGEPEHGGVASADIGLTQQFLSGGQLFLGGAMNIAGDLTGLNATTVGSTLSANFTQPLIQGAWRGLSYEKQYRAERDLLFAAYGYDRFTQTFATSIMSEYFDVLTLRDRLENDKANIARLKQTLALTAKLVEGGMVSPLEQDQAQQDLLNAQVRYQQSDQAYNDALDKLKIDLGLPTLARVEVDYPHALDALSANGPQDVPMGIDKAIEIAFSSRPDVLAAAAHVRDADRDVDIAADHFNPQLDLSLGASLPSKPDRDFYKFNLNRNNRSANVIFDYPLDQTDNRDAYRVAIINFERSKRDLDEFLDSVRLEVRSAYRGLEQSRQSYELQRQSVQIAQRRTKLARLQQQNGEAAARDVLEAEEALRIAQNGLTTALIEYTNTRLEFLAALGLVQVDEKGCVHERSEPVQFQKILRLYPYLRVK